MRSLLEEALRRLIDDYAREEPRPPFQFTTFRGTGYTPGVTPQQALTMANDRGGSDHLGVVIALDTNLLIYAHREEVPFHQPALESLTGLVRSGRAWALPWPCVHEFISTVTNRRVFARTDAHRRWRSIACASWSPPTFAFSASPPPIWTSWIGCSRPVASTGPKVHDARIAAICIGHGVSELWTADRDFSYFPELRTRNPLVGRD